MLVPRTPLLILVGCFVLPCAILGGAVPGAQGPAALVLAIFTGAAVIDAIRARGRLGGVTVRLGDGFRPTLACAQVE